MNIKMPRAVIIYKFHNIINNIIENEFLVKRKFGSLGLLHKSTKPNKDEKKRFKDRTNLIQKYER